MHAGAMQAKCAIWRFLFLLNRAGMWVSRQLVSRGRTPLAKEPPPLNSELSVRAYAHVPYSICNQ